MVPLDDWNCNTAVVTLCRTSAARVRARPEEMSRQVVVQLYVALLFVKFGCGFHMFPEPAVYVHTISLFCSNKRRVPGYYKFNATAIRNNYVLYSPVID